MAATCPGCQIICGYGSSFSNDNKEGESAAEKFNTAGVDIVAHHAGSTGTAMMRMLTSVEKPVIGFGTDEWITNYGSGTVPGSEYIIGSILKKIDAAVTQSIKKGLDGSFSGRVERYGVHEGGIGFKK